MGIFDFLSDLSKARTKDELGLGGMRSLLGTRGAAPEGKRGEEMMRRTSTDNLPGYFNPETREYVPWYVDLFDGGGLNKSEGLLANDAQKTPSAVDMLKTNGAPVQRASQMAPGLGSQLSDMEMANRNRASQMTPSLGSQLSDMEMANRNRASQMTPSLGSQLSDMEMENRNRVPQMTPSLGSQLSDMEMANRNRVGAAGYGPMGQTTQSPMMQHPAFPQFVDIMKRMGNESVLQNPEQASFVFNNYLKQIGYN